MPSTIEAKHPLHLAVEKGTLFAIRELLKSGADCAVRDHTLVSAIRLAAINQRTDAYQIMLDACGGIERSNAVDPVFRNDQTIDELIVTATSLQVPVNEEATTALVARGKEAVPTIVNHLDTAHPFHQNLYTALERMGPVVAAKARPKLVSQLETKSRLVESRLTLNRLEPGYFERLPAEKRRKFEAVQLDAIMTGLMGQTQYGATHEYMPALAYIQWLSDESLLKVLTEGRQALREAAVGALNYRTDHSNTDDVVLRELENSLRSVVLDQSWKLQIRVWAIWALGNLPLSPSTADAMLELMRSAGTDDVTKRNLGRPGKPNLPESIGRMLVQRRHINVRQLATMLTPRNNPSRVGAVAGLAWGRLEDVPQMVELLNDEDAAIASGMAEAAKRYGEKKMITGWITMNLRKAEQDARSVPDAATMVFGLRKNSVDQLVSAAVSTEYSARFRIAAARLAVAADLTDRQRKQLAGVVPVCGTSLRFAADEAVVYWATDVILSYPESDAALSDVEQFFHLYRKGADLTPEYDRILDRLKQTLKTVRGAAEK